MKIKRVLVDLERLKYPNSGIANVFKNLVIGLSSLKKEIPIFYYGDYKNFIDLPIGKKESLKKKIWDKNSSFFYKKFEVIHVSHQLTTYFKKKRKQQKKIVTLHDLNFLYENLSQKKKNKICSLVNRNLSNADVIVCISNFVKEDLKRNWSLFNFVSEPKIKMVYNGLDFSQIDSVDKSMGSYEYLKNKEYLLNIGVLFPKKNQLSLIRMLPYIKEDLVFIVSDSKPEYELTIKEEIEKYKCNNRVHILKNVNNQEKLGLLKNCKALCHPSLAEGFGIPPIEAMFFKKPVFLSRHTSLPEIGGEVAFYFDTFEVDKMVSNLEEGFKIYNKTKDYGEKLKERALFFNNERMAKEYYAIYEDLVYGG